MCKIFQIFLLKSFPHRRLFYFDGCAIAQLDKCTMHNCTDWTQLTRRSFIGLWARARLLGSCLLHMEARYAKRTFAQYRSLKHHACSCTKSVSRCFSYVWSTTDMAHQENENLDQKLHLPKMQNSVPVQSFALGAVIKRINYLTFYLALQYKLQEIHTPKYKPFVRNTEESDIDGMWIGCLTSWNSLWRSSTAWCCTSVCLKEKSELINRTNHVEP